MVTERRGHPRYEIMAQVRVESGNVNYVLYVRNVSMSGLLLSGEPDGQERLTVGRMVELDIFSLSDLDNIRVSGKIVREHSEGGYGVEFTEMKDDARKALEAMVELAYEQSIHPPPLPKK